MINNFFTGLEHNNAVNPVRRHIQKLQFRGHTFLMNDDSRINTTFGERKCLAYGAIMDGHDRVLAYCTGSNHNRQIVGYIPIEQVNAQLFNLSQDLGEN